MKAHGGSCVTPTTSVTGLIVVPGRVTDGNPFGASSSSLPAVAPPAVDPIGIALTGTVGALHPANPAKPIIANTRIIIILY